MFDLFKKILSSDADSIQPSDQDKVTAHLALTVLLMEAANADGECSREEKDHLMHTLETHFKISRQEIERLLLLRDQSHSEYVDLFQYTRCINDHFTESQKIDIMVAVWRIILLDNHLEAHEDHFAHKLASLLRLSHQDLIHAKLRARKELS